MAMIDILEERYRAGKRLRPCPFCGGTYKESLTIIQDEYSRFYVFCYSASAGNGCGMESGRRHTLEDLIDLWNTRFEEVACEDTERSEE